MPSVEPIILLALHWFSTEFLVFFSLKSTRVEKTLSPVLLDWILDRRK